MGYTKITEELKQKAKTADLVGFLRARHPGSIQFSGHPDEPRYVCWRGVAHDSITFYIREEETGQEAWRFTRHSTFQSDDAIQYLMEYEGYRYADAVMALAYFDPR